MPANRGWACFIGLGCEGGIRGIRGKIRTRFGALWCCDVCVDLGRPSWFPWRFSGWIGHAIPSVMMHRRSGDDDGGWVGGGAADWGWWDLLGVGHVWGFVWVLEGVIGNLSLLPLSKGGFVSCSSWRRRGRGGEGAGRLGEAMCRGGGSFFPPAVANFGFGGIAATLLGFHTWTGIITRFLFFSAAIVVAAATLG